MKISCLHGDGISNVNIKELVQFIRIVKNLSLLQQ